MAVGPAPAGSANGCTAARRNHFYDSAMSKCRTATLAIRRRNHYDVTNRIRISHPQDVSVAVCALLGERYPDANLATLRRAFKHFGRLYAGTLPGYCGCDTWYHDAQHSLDCALAMVRLLDGHERSVTIKQRLGARHCVLGILIALFHDAGYIRRRQDPVANGAGHTLTHVRRSGEFLAGYLPQLGYADEVATAQQLVHFTGYEIALERIQVDNDRDRMLGFLLGSADVLAQASDRCYLEKCRDFLYRELAICGLAGAARAGGPQPIYRSPEDLLVKTAGFHRRLWAERMNGHFGGVHRFLDTHFAGANPYRLAIDAHLLRIKRLVRTRRLHELKCRPLTIDAPCLRRYLEEDRSSVPQKRRRIAKPKRRGRQRLAAGARTASPRPTPRGSAAASS